MTHEAPTFTFTVTKLTRGGRVARHILTGQRQVTDHEYGLVKRGAVEAVFAPLYDEYTKLYGRIALTVFKEGVRDSVIDSGEWSRYHHVAVEYRYIPTKERRAEAAWNAAS